MMTLNTLLFKEVNILPELFLGISIVYLVLHCTFLSMQKSFPLIQNSVLNLGILVLFFVWFLLINDRLDVLSFGSFNNTIVFDYVSFSSKTIITILSALCLLMMSQYLTDQKLNHFEYILLILLAILGLFLLCSSNDLITAYLAIELQSLAFYVLAAFKKNSTFSVESGVKYFILGAFSSSLFLFGSSILYGISGTVNFEEFRDLFFYVVPGETVNPVTDVSTTFSEISKKIMSPNFLVTGLNSSEINALIAECKEFTDPSSICVYEKFFAYHTLYITIMDNLSGSYDAKLINNLIDSGKGITVTDLPHYVSMNEAHLELQAHKPDDSTSSNVFRLTWMYLDTIMEYLKSSKCTGFDESYQKNFILNKTSVDIGLLQVGLVLILISLFFKLAIAPFHVWAPDVYEGSPSSSSFFFSVVPKLGIFVLLLKIFHYSFFGMIDYWRHFISIVIVLTILAGSFGGLEQRKVKSLLAYSSISHMGYSLIAFSTGTLEGIQMLFCYLIIYSFSGLCVWSIFIILRLKNNYESKGNKDLTDLVLLSKSNRMLAIFFATVLLSVAGFPPMIGFLVKINIFLSSMESAMYFVALISILCSVVATFYYIRIIKVLFFEKVLVGQLYYPLNTQKSLLIVGLFFSLLFLFVNPSLLFLFSYKLSLLVNPI
uniref:NADH dehydrogenase subunit 2 n=1 Tax=Hemiaulus sinensis TaxID=1003062 RepID=UPI0020293515|nr:NADH dehydrogenase subunit 2 [Hemiaulus sinensis]QYB23205.1 NADH dehydrogenase subunit 2 [Hemiaulus sinensis]